MASCTIHPCFLNICVWAFFFFFFKEEDLAKGCAYSGHWVNMILRWEGLDTINVCLRGREEGFLHELGSYLLAICVKRRVRDRGQCFWMNPGKNELGSWTSKIPNIETFKKQTICEDSKVGHIAHVSRNHCEKHYLQLWRRRQGIFHFLGKV